MEGNILLFIQDNIRQPWLNPVMVGITSLGDAGLVWALICFTLFLIPKTRRLGTMCCFAFLFMVILNNLIIKEIVDRARPFVTVKNLIPLGRIPSDSSFPSGHTASSFAVATVILCRTKLRTGIPCMILAVLISLSRLYVGVHYPTDVLVGFFVGILCAFIGMKVGNFAYAKVTGRFPVLARFPFCGLKKKSED